MSHSSPIFRKRETITRDSCYFLSRTTKNTRARSKFSSNRHEYRLTLKVTNSGAQPRLASDVEARRGFPRCQFPVISRRNEQKLLPTKGSNESEKTFSVRFKIRADRASLTRRLCFQCQSHGSRKPH